MKYRIIFATGNQGKMKEIRLILADLGVEILSMKEAGIEVDVVEDGMSFEENAMIKARAIGKLLPEDVILADDSGLVIDYLGGEPGIYSARYLGGTPYSEKNRILIERMDKAPESERAARFVCAIAAVLPGGQELCATACMEGSIAYEAAGEGGFGYDPILMVPEYGVTSAELTMDQKNELSHRGKALRLMKQELINRLGEERS